MSNVNLSKSKYCRAVQCNKILWLDKYKPEFAEPTARESVLQNGTEVGDNIGHEIINLLQDNDSNKYVYIVPYGTIGKEHKNVTKILLTSAVIGNEFEVIAVADVNQNFSKENSVKEKNELHKDQAIYKYNERCLYNIFKDNAYNDEAVYTTFKVTSIKKPKKRIIFKMNNKKDGKKYFELSKEESTEKKLVYEVGFQTRS